MRAGRRSARHRGATSTLLRVLGAATAAAALASTVTVAAHAVPSRETWAAELSVDGGDDSNVTASDGAVRLSDRSPRTTSTGPAPAEGELLLAPRRPAAVTDRVSAEITADTPAGSRVLVAVRGIRGDGSWSQWSPAAAGKPATLPEATYEVQVRVTLVAGPDGTGPSLQRLWLTADRAPAASKPTTAAPLQATVFATRIGLVGNNTANGHRVRPDDRFAALPSRRGLSPRGTGDYTVVVCSSPTRCSWVPVWDVGPWNTTDDYWSAPGTREEFGDLPRGVPEARAAYSNGYRGGRDGFGRRVANPAGIDLADGTFRDLGLRDNGDVTVTYLWTGSGPAGTAKAGDVLTVRSAPSADAASVGTVVPPARMAVECATNAGAPAGRAGTGERWLRIGTDRFVPADRVEVGNVPAC